ncbi:MAG TPA: hypothetical protein VFH27_14795, partial [Longimicrobiaceae bacterium]|nr:hypothetical protein [Longimicrobiaceae bacterium]
AGASLFTGMLAGFMFGIPKTVQRKPDRSLRPATAQTDYQSNTNLEDISDWLTKILIGIGLVELREVPGMIDGVAGYWASSLGTPAPRAFAAGLLVYFSINGFFVGYLWTRLALVGDFIDEDPRRIVSDFVKRVARATEKNPNLTERSPAREVVTRKDIDAAEELAQLSATSGVSMEELRSQLQTLAAQYEAVRASMPRSPARTRRLEVIASQMRSFSIAAHALLPEFVQSDSPGGRLVAITFLQTRPSFSLVEWLAERLGEEQAFLGYHAAVALQHAARAAEGRECLRVRDSIEHAMELAKHLEDDADRVRVLRDALRIVTEKIESAKRGS